VTALPGSVAEIAASPKGPSVGAFFDFDGTLMAGFSASRASRGT
jgi:putative phosphoserine phosphatase / 1-acylglycerol-3-phosphate O-acyltransferase